MEILNIKVTRVRKVYIEKSDNVGVDVILQRVNLDDLIKSINISLTDKYAVSPKGSREKLEVKVVNRHLI